MVRDIVKDPLFLSIKSTDAGREDKRRISGHGPAQAQGHVHRLYGADNPARDRHDQRNTDIDAVFVIHMNVGNCAEGFIAATAG